MCGDNSRQSQGGALAVLSLSHDAFGSPVRSGVPLMAGRLTFRDEEEWGNTSASHVTFLADTTTCSLPPPGETLMIGIHEAGDLTISAIMSPFKFKLSLANSTAAEDDDGFYKRSARLDHPLTVGVGGDGIIGRRVTVWTSHSVVPFAEGIIGFN